MLFYNALAALNRTLARGCKWFAALGLVAMTVIIGWQVFSRYVLNSSPNWSETFCLFLMIYYILFAAAAGVREGTHIGLGFIRDSLPPAPRRVVLVLINLIVGAFGVGMVYFGWDMVMTTWTHVIPTLEIPTGLSYLPFPLAGVMFVIFSFEHIVAALVGKEVNGVWNS